MIDGRPDAGGVGELERVVAGLSGTVCLHLTGLRSVDEAGLEAVRALRDRGITLMGASRYLRLLLGAGGRRRNVREQQGAGK